MMHAVGEGSLAGHPGFACGTLATNVTGSFAMGVVAGWFAMRGQADRRRRPFLATGIIGGFKTYPTFSHETALLWERGDFPLAFLYVGGTRLLGLVGIFWDPAMVRALA